MFPPGLYKNKNQTAMAATQHAQENVRKKNPNWQP
jgi:hypothetical protein